MTNNSNDVIAPTAQAATPAITFSSLCEAALFSLSPFLVVMFKSLHLQRYALSRALSSCHCVSNVIFWLICYVWFNGVHSYVLVYVFLLLSFLINKDVYTTISAILGVPWCHGEPRIIVGCQSLVWHSRDLVDVLQNYFIGGASEEGESTGYFLAPGVRFMDAAQTPPQRPTVLLRPSTWFTGKETLLEQKWRKE